MKPVKTFLPFARWLLRILMPAWILINYIGIIRGMDIHNLNFYIALAFVLFGLLLFAGGFSSKPGLTVISAIFLTLLFIYRIYLNFIPEVTETQIISFVFLSISIYFMSSANK